MNENHTTPKTDTKASEPCKPETYPRIEMLTTERKHTLALLLICAGIYLPVMGSYGMFDPWETHYTEVARQFMVRHDWLSTYWHNGRGPEGYSETNFWTKPVGSFWLSGLSLKLFGYSEKTTGEELARGNPEWAVRLPFFLSGLFGILCAYLMCARLFSRRAGFFAGVIMATAPMYFMISRQAMTDMPYVGLISGGLALFALAVFGKEEPLPRRETKLGKWTIQVPFSLHYLLFLLAFLTFMTLQLYAIINPLLRIPIAIHGRPITLLGMPLSTAIWMVLYIALALFFLFLSLKTRTKNEVYLYTFYMVVGIAGLSKGLVAALQPGLIILVYLITSREWRLLTQVALGRGLLVAVCIFCPWFHGMVARYGKAFWNELFGTEQLRRLTIGEQAQAKGTFEYYVSQIGYGLFPWIAFLPAAVIRAFSLRSEPREARDRARLFLYVWLIGTVALFTLTITKYHHYILPAIAPAAILIAIFLDDLIEGRVRGQKFLLLLSLFVLVMVAFDLVQEPANWVWMYTYLYDRNWAQGVPESTPILYLSIAVGVVILATFGQRFRRQAIWALIAVTVVAGGIILNWYQIKVAPHWSQKEAIATYYKLRKSSEEELVAWQFNWRGETWYTAADVVVSKSLDNTAILQYLKQRPNRRFFFITERGRYASLRSMLPTEKAKKTLKIVYNENVHYILAEASL